MTTVDELRERLAEARAELKLATRALAPKHKGGEWARYRAACERCSKLERAIARTLGEEYAVPLDWSHPWDSGAPMPHVLSSGHVTLLIYLIAEPEPNWNGTTVDVVETAADNVELLAVVQFNGCVAHKFGGPNDEVLSGHPLYQRGLEPYSAHTIENSSWIEQQRAINSVHAQYAPERWLDYKHYMLLFHDEIFECIAREYKVQALRSTFEGALNGCVQRLLQ